MTGPTDDPFPYEVRDIPEGFVAPDPAADVKFSDTDTTTEPVTSGAGVTSLLDRARSGKGKKKNDATTEQPNRAKPRKPAPQIPRGGFEPSITKMYQTLGALTLPFNPQVGTTLIEIAPDAAKALDQLARDNIAFRRFLVAITQTTTLGAVIAAHAPLIAVIVAQAMNGNPAMASMATLFAVPDPDANENPGGEPAS